jgi:hypothetical protein
MKQQLSSAGFSTVELLVTLFVAAAFVGAFYQLFVSTSQGSVETKRYATASALAYSNLNQFQSKPSGMAACSTSYTYKPSGFNPPITGSVNGLPGTVTQTVTASYPFTCGQNDDVIKVESSVTYGPSGNQTTVTHATYVNK